MSLGREGERALLFKVNATLKCSSRGVHMDVLNMLVPLAAATRISACEVQGWANARMQCKGGARKRLGIFAEITHVLATLLYLLWVAFVAFKIGVGEAAIVVLVSTGLVIAYRLVSAPNRPWKWLTGLTIVWPLTTMLYYLVA